MSSFQKIYKEIFPDKELKAEENSLYVENEGSKIYVADLCLTDNEKPGSEGWKINICYILPKESFEKEPELDKKLKVVFGEDPKVEI